MLTSFVKRVEVVLGAAVTFLVALGIAVSEAVNVIAPELPDGWQDNAVSIGGTAVAWIGSAVAIIRRVSPVQPAERGLLDEGFVMSEAFRD